MATRGAMMSPSTDPPSRMSTFSEAVTLPVTSPSTDDGLREDLSLDLAVRADGEHMVLQLDLPLDLSFDGQIFAAVQLALDDDGLSDVHHIPLDPPVIRLRRRRRACRRNRDDRRRGCRLSAGRFHRFITLPHVASFRPPMGVIGNSTCAWGSSWGEPGAMHTRKRGSGWARAHRVYRPLEISV